MSLQDLEAEVARLTPAEIQIFSRWFEAFKGGPSVSNGTPKPTDPAPTPSVLGLKSFSLKAKSPLPSRSEIADEMFGHR